MSLAECAAELSVRWNAPVTGESLRMALRKGEADTAAGHDTLPQMTPAAPVEEAPRRLTDREVMVDIVATMAEEEEPEEERREPPPLINQLVRLTCRKAQPTHYLCSKLGLSEAELSALALSGVAAGYQIQTRDGHIYSQATVGGHAKTIIMGDATYQRHHVAIATDLHFGSTHCDEDALLSFLHTAWERGCRKAVATGDILDGIGDKLRADQTYIGFDGQAGRATRLMRKAPPFEWVAIDGNHDGYHSAACGMVSGQILESRMREAGVSWTFAGVCLGRAVIHGAKWHLWHPHGGASSRNAVRRILNERAESLEEACDILAMGHLHKFVSLPVYPEDIHAIAGGTFQRKRSEFANRISKPWDVGGVIASYETTREGIIERAAEFIAA